MNTQFLKSKFLPQTWERWLRASSFGRAALGEQLRCPAHLQSLPSPPPVAAQPSPSPAGFFKMAICLCRQGCRRSLGIRCYSHFRLAKVFVVMGVFLALIINVDKVCSLEQNAPFSDLQRLSEQPVLAPRPGKFDSAGAFNPSAVRLADGRIIMLYRGQDLAGVSKIGYAQSKDGIHFQQDDEPVLQPQFPDEKNGVEDPRLSRSLQDPNEWLMTATAYNEDAQLALYKSGDLRKWERVGIIMPANKGAWNVHWTKSGAIVPEKIKGKCWMYYMGDAADVHDQIGIASSADGIHWQDASEKPLLSPRPHMFDSHTVEPGPAPLVTKDGILLLYNGADDQLCYRTGWALFDKKDPTKLIARSDKPIFEPKLEWEKKNASPGVHQVPNVVFVEGMVKDGDRYLVYYGAADSYVGVAETRLLPFSK